MISEAQRRLYLDRLLDQVMAEDEWTITIPYSRYRALLDAVDDGGD